MSLQQLKLLAKKYNDHIAVLFVLGSRGLTTGDTIDYIKEFKFTQEDIPELLKLAQDMDILMFDYSDMSNYEGQEFYGVIHAWYALSMLKASQARYMFIHLIENTGDGYLDDWILSGFRDLIKPYRQEIYPYFIETILTERHNQWVRVEYLGVLRDMVQEDEIEMSTIDTLIETILKTSKDEIVNAVAISTCIKFKFIHHHDLIAQCFAEETVDIDHVGDLEDVEIAMGLKTKREHPKKLNEMQKIFASFHKNNEPKTYVREEQKISRNDLCPCRSGKKYKKCCQKKELAQ